MTEAAFPQLFAHRGASADRVEQTRSAYLEAIVQGADGVETDVRLTVDGALVCWHDSDVQRIAGTAGAVHEMTLAELRAVAPGGPDELLTLPQLLELLVAAGRPLRLALEIKQPSPFGAELDEAVLACLAGFGWNTVSGRLGGGELVAVDIMCFWPQTVAFLAERVGPGVAMLLFEDIAGEDVDDSRAFVELVRWVETETGGRMIGDAARDSVREAARLRQAQLADTSIALGPDVALVRRLPDLARTWAATRPVRVWTVNDVKAARACLDIGVRELTTDRPGALRAELSRVLGDVAGPADAADR